MTRVALIGAGWAGATAALTLARAGVNVTVFEANAVPGGRARTVDKAGRTFDNGQHLLLAAYSRSLAVIASLHPVIDSVYLRLPLTLRSAPRISIALSLTAPDVPAPLHLLIAIVTAKGLSFANKLSAVFWTARHLSGGQIDENATVLNLIAPQPVRVRQLLWEPLCVAALNTPPETAAASVFVEVLRRAFTGDAQASDLIIPRVDLTTLLPGPALAEVASRGGNVTLGAYVASAELTSAGACVTLRDESTHEFDFAIVATGPQHVPRLLANVKDASSVVDALRALSYEPITTLHFDFACVGLGVNEHTPMLMLDGAPGQWLFWRPLPNGHWRACVVISAAHRADGESSLLAAALSQLKQSYSLPPPTWQIAVTERRATYACTPEQSQRLAVLPKRIGRLFFAGDWCVPELPATLEAAVISGERAAQLILSEVNHG